MTGEHPQNILNIALEMYENSPHGGYLLFRTRKQKQALASVSAVIPDIFLSSQATALLTDLNEEPNCAFLDASEICLARLKCSTYEVCANSATCEGPEGNHGIFHLQ